MSSSEVKFHEEPREGSIVQYTDTDGVEGSVRVSSVTPDAERPGWFRVEGEFGEVLSGCVETGDSESVETSGQSIQQPETPPSAPLISSTPPVAPTIQPRRSDSPFVWVAVVMGCGLLAIAVIAILAAILFPVFARARESARRSTCLSNLKQLSVVYMMYSSDYEGLPPSSLIRDPYYTTSPDPDFLFPGDNSVDEDSPTIVSVFEPYVKNTDFELWYCPSDPHTYPGVSYIYRPCIDMASMQGIREDEYEYPAMQAVFIERLDFHLGGRNDGWRAGTRLQAAFADGHVAITRLGNINPVPVDSIYNRSVLTSPDPPLYYFWDHEIDSPAGPGAYDPRRFSDKVGLHDGFDY